MTAGGGGASAVVRAAGFPLLLLLHAMIFIRPAEFSPQLLGLPIYEACILACLATAYHLMADQLRPAALGTRPVNACALGMLPAIVLSGLANLDPNHAVDDGLEFFKLLIYFFLLVGIVDTVGRLKGLLSALGLFATVITTVAVLQYHGVIDLPALKFVVTPGDEWGTEEAMIRRLGSTGVFQDPNDMCLMLVLAMVVCGVPGDRAPPVLLAGAVRPLRALRCG